MNPSRVDALVDHYLQLGPIRGRANAEDPLYRHSIQQLRRTLRMVEEAMRIEGIDPEIAHRVLRTVMLGTPDESHDAMARVMELECSLAALGPRPAGKIMYRGLRPDGTGIYGRPGDEVPAKLHHGPLHGTDQVVKLDFRGDAPLLAHFLHPTEVGVMLVYSNPAPDSGVFHYVFINEVRHHVTGDTPRAMP